MTTILLSLLASPTLPLVLSLLAPLLIGALLISPGTLMDFVGVGGLTSIFSGLLTPFLGTPLITLGVVFYGLTLIVQGILQGVGIGGVYFAIIALIGFVCFLIADMVPGLNTTFATVLVPLAFLSYPPLYHFIAGNAWQGITHGILWAITGISYLLTNLTSPVTGITISFPVVTLFLVITIATVMDMQPTTGFLTFLPAMLSAAISGLTPIIGPTIGLALGVIVFLVGAIYFIAFYVIGLVAGGLEGVALVTTVASPIVLIVVALLLFFIMFHDKTSVSVYLIGLTFVFLGLLTPWAGTPLITVGMVFIALDIVLFAGLEGVGVGAITFGVIVLLSLAGASIVDMTPGVNTIMATIWIPLLFLLHPVLSTTLFNRPYAAMINGILWAIDGLLYLFTNLISPGTGVTVFSPTTTLLFALTIATVLDMQPTTGLLTFLPAALTPAISGLTPIVGPTMGLVSGVIVFLVGAVYLIAYYVLSWPLGLLEGVAAVASTIPFLLTPVFAWLSTFTFSIVPPLATISSVLTPMIPISTLTPTLSPTLSTILSTAITVALFALVGGFGFTVSLPTLVTSLLEVLGTPTLTSTSTLPTLSTILSTISSTLSAIVPTTSSILSMTSSVTLSTISLLFPTLTTLLTLSSTTSPLLITLSSSLVSVVTPLLLLASTFLPPTLTTLSTLAIIASPFITTATLVGLTIAAIVALGVVIYYVGVLLSVPASALGSGVAALGSGAASLGSGAVSLGSGALIGVPASIGAGALSVPVALGDAAAGIAAGLGSVPAAIGSGIAGLGGTAAGLGATALGAPAALASGTGASGAGVGAGLLGAPAAALGVPAALGAAASSSSAGAGGLGAAIPAALAPLGIGQTQGGLGLGGLGGGAPLGQSGLGQNQGGLLGPLAALAATLLAPLGALMGIEAGRSGQSSGPFSDIFNQSLFKINQDQVFNRPQGQVQEQNQTQEQDETQEQGQNERNSLVGISVPNTVSAIIERIKAVASDLVGMAAPNRSVTIIQGE